MAALRERLRAFGLVGTKRLEVRGEVRARYDEQLQLLWTRPTMVRASHILLENPVGTPEEAEAHGPLLGRRCNPQAACGGPARGRLPQRHELVGVTEGDGRTLFLVGDPHPSNRATLARSGHVSWIFEVPRFDPLSGAHLEAWLDRNDLSGCFPD